VRTSSSVVAAADSAGVDSAATPGCCALLFRFLVDLGFFSTFSLSLSLTLASAVELVVDTDVFFFLAFLVVDFVVAGVISASASAKSTVTDFFFFFLTDFGLASSLPSFSSTADAAEAVEVRFFFLTLLGFVGMTASLSSATESKPSLIVMVD
jgi:hypothetical protein